MIKLGSCFFVVFCIGLLLCQCKNRNAPVSSISPTNTIKTVCPKIKPIYNIYVENSGSMNGYVKGITEFEQSVYNYLTDIKISKLTDSFNLYYINSRIISQGGDIADFIEKLEPNSFAQKGGNIGATDISNIIELALANSADHIVTMLVSDFIFSPGRGKNADQYLVNQQIGIKKNIADHLNKYPNHAVIIYQLESKFEGRYFNRIDAPIHIKNTRPFYIWIVGHSDNLFELIKKCPEIKFQGAGIKNSFSMMQGGKSVNYAIQYGSGDFKPDKRDPQKSIVNAKKDSKGMGDKKMRFCVNADFSKLLCSDSYLMNPTNYNLSDKDYQLNITKISSEKFTHALELSTDVVKPTTLNISLNSSIPEWVEEYNDDNGLTIDATTMHKTYGLKYLIHGIYEAFTKDEEYYTNMKINVNK